VNSRDLPLTFEAVVGRIASRDLAYVWRIDDGKQSGVRLPLRRALAKDKHGQSIEIIEGMHVAVEVDPTTRTRIIRAQIIRPIVRRPFVAKGLT